MFTRHKHKGGLQQTFPHSYRGSMIIEGILTNREVDQDLDPNNLFDPNDLNPIKQINLRKIF